MIAENNFIFEFQAAMAATGIHCNDEIIADGKLHRFTVSGDKQGSLTGWYVLYADAIPAGAFGCWRRDIKQKWCSRNLQTLSSEEKAAFNKRMEEAREKGIREQEKVHAETKKRAEHIWSESLSVNNHPYLTCKNVKSYGLRIYKNALVIPLYDTGNILHNLQFVYSENNQFKKRFLSGGKKKGLAFLIGEITNPTYIAEGYATAATIHEATQCGVFVAFDCGNLLAATKNIKNKYPAHNLIIAADNDQFTENNPGLTKTKEAAHAIGAKVVIPDFSNFDLASKPTDFNDLMLLAGIEEVKRQLQTYQIKDFTSSNDLSSDDVIIKELASLTQIGYDRKREEYAEKLGVRVSTLDEAVKTERNKGSHPDKAIILSNIEPWQEQVDGSALLFSLTEKLQQFVILSEYEAIAIALWVLFTYCIDAVDVASILNISSPEKRCGKSTLMSLLQLLVNRPLLAANVSPAAIFRTIEALNPTLLLDETDTFINDEKSELRGIINSGHTRSTAFVIRTVGDTHEPRVFSTWGAKCLAGIGNLPDTIKDRSIIIQLRRKLPHEIIESLRHADKSIFTDIQKKCVRFAKDNFDVLQRTKPNIPKELNDRAADSWEPLIAIADIIGGACPEQARKAAVALSSTDEAVSLSVELLQDIKEIFHQKRISRISTTDLLEKLCNDNEAPWATYNRGKPIAARQLSKKLKDFGIKSKDMRFGQDILKGYELESFNEVFDRYIPSTSKKDLLSATSPDFYPQHNATSATLPAKCCVVADSCGYKTTELQIEDGLEPKPSADCRAVAGKIPIFAVGEHINSSNDRLEFTL